MKILLREVKEAEKEYASALQIWGENNQITIRAMIKWCNLKRQYEIQKGRKNETRPIQNCSQS